MQVVLVQDPEVSSIMQQMGQATQGGNRGREKRFIFDHAFDGTSSNTAVYRGTVAVSPSSSSDVVQFRASFSDPPVMAPAISQLSSGGPLQ